MPEFVYPPVLLAVRALFKAQGIRFDLRGTENVPRTGGAVMAMNHTGYFDFTYAGYAAQPSGRLVRFMAKREVFDHPVAGPLMRGMRHIPVDRAAGAASFRAAVDALRAGEVVGVFPEATISMSFELKNFKNGAVRLARDAGVPLLPVACWGSQRVWTKGRPRHLGRTGTPVTVSVGEPFSVAPDAVPDEATAELRRRIQALLDDVQADYPDRPAGPEDAWWLPVRLGGTAPSPDEAAVEEKRIRAEQAQRYRDRAARKG